jgi:hypothetical protein
MGQDWFYRSGDLFLPKRYVDLLDTYIVGSDTSVFYINYWTILHFFSGILFAVLTPSPVDIPFQFFVLHTIWELWQIIIGMTPMNLRGFVDTIMDTIAGLLGVYLSIQKWIVQGQEFSIRQSQNAQEFNRR